MKLAGSLLTLLFLLNVFVQAPFLHFNERIDTEHVKTLHHSLLISHTHLIPVEASEGNAGGDLSAFQEFNAPRFLDWFQANLGTNWFPPALPAKAALIALPETSCDEITIPRYRTHDPPLAYLLFPRAPPTTRIL